MTGDYAICALPFSVLRDIEVLKPFSREKQKAIRELNYNASAKILFQVAAPLLGGGGRHRRRARPSPTCRSAASATRRTAIRSKRGNAARLATRGARMRCAGARWTRSDDRAGARRRRPDPSPIRDEFEVGAVQDWYDDPTRAAPSPCSNPSSRRASRLDRPAGGPRPLRRASTRRCTTRGSRARSSRASARHARSTRPFNDSSRFDRSPRRRSAAPGRVLGGGPRLRAARGSKRGRRLRPDAAEGRRRPQPLARHGAFEAADPAADSPRPLRRGPGRRGRSA